MVLMNKGEVLAGLVVKVMSPGKDNGFKTFDLLPDLTDLQLLKKHDRRSANILACKCHGHDGDHNNQGDGPQKKGNAVDDHRQKRVLLVKVNDAFHRVWFGVSIGF
jgi:hypothetical protein